MIFPQQGLKLGLEQLKSDVRTFWLMPRGKKSSNW